MLIFDSVHQVLRKITHNTQFTHNTQSVARTLKKCNKPLPLSKEGFGEECKHNRLQAGSSSQDYDLAFKQKKAKS